MEFQKIKPRRAVCFRSKQVIIGLLFIFVSRSRQSIKLLFWEHGGFVIYYKRMDNGRFEVPPLRADGQGRHISEIQLLQVLRGIEFQKEKQRKRTRQTTLVLEQ